MSVIRLKCINVIGANSFCDAVNLNGSIRDKKVDADRGGRDGGCCGVKGR